MKGSWKIEEDKLTFQIPRIKLRFEGTMNDAGDEATGEWSQGGRKLPLTLKRQPTEYDSENVWENRPQRPKGPFPYNSKLVTFKNEKDDVTLSGTLTIPKKEGSPPSCYSHQRLRSI